MDKTLTLIANNEQQTIDLAMQVSKYCYPGLVICLTGDLGAGKTTFVKGLAKGLDIKEKVLSPTFNILKCYFNKTLNLYHIDAYRLEDTNKDIGLEEYIDGDGVCAIEWPQYIKEYIPSHILNIELLSLANNSRQITFTTNIEKLFIMFDNLTIRKDDD